MKDERLYAKFTLDFPDHPKILCLSNDAKWALVELTIYSRRHMTDGFIPKAVALAKHGLDVCQELVTNDVENPSLIEADNGFVIHDFASHQSTRAEIEELTSKRRRAGQKGGQARAKASAKQVLKQNASKSNPETETETETKEENTSCSLPAVLVDPSIETPDPAIGHPRAPIPIPDDWAPSDIHRARYPRPDLDELAEGFRDHAVSVGRTCAGPAGWNAAFSTWVRKSRPPDTPGVGAATTKAQGWLALAEQLPPDDDPEQRAITR